MSSLRKCSCFLVLAAWIQCFWLQPARSQQVTESPSNSGESAQGDREQTIYVPYSKLREVFEKEGRGVFLPYDQFQRLWNAARTSERLPTHSGPPVDSIITDSISEATVRQDVVQVQTTLSIELLKQGWNTVPLRLKGAALQSATIDGEVARITPTAEGGYQLLVKNSVQEPQHIELKLTYAKAINKSPGQNSVAFEAPQAPVSRWTIRIPQAGVKVNVTPMIAAMQSDAASIAPEIKADSQPDGPKDETLLLAFVGSAPEVSIHWTPKSEGASGLTALTSVQAQQELFISEGALRTRAMLEYSISRSQLEKLTVEVPADHKVVNVFDPNVRKWDVQSLAADRQTISIDLFEPATSQQRLTVELEKFIDESQIGKVEAPVIRCLDVGRQQGVVVVRVDPALRAETTNRVGLLQIDASEVPTALSNQSWDSAFRYAAMPFELTISLEKVVPRISMEQLLEYYLEPELLSLDLLAVVNIEQAGVFQLEFDVPSDFEILQVRGREIQGGAPAQVDAFRREGNAGDRLIVDLARKAMGKVALVIQLQRRISDANLMTPTGTQTTVTLPMTKSVQPFTSQFDGKVIVNAPESLRLNPSSTTGLRAIGLSDAFDAIPSARDGRFEKDRPTFAFAFSEQSPPLALAAERRSPYVTARQMMIVRTDSGVVKFESTIIFDVLYSGVKTLRIDVPSAISAEIRNSSSGLRDAVMEPQPQDVAQGYLAWQLIADSEILGSRRVRLNWEQKTEELAVGSSLTLAVPHLQPKNLDRAWGQIAVTKTESLDVEPSGEPQGLRPIDPVYDLLKDVPVTDAAQAFEFVDNWTLELKATRYQLEEVKRTSIERALIRTVVTRSQQRSVQALYRIRSARQRLGIKLAADAVFDSQPARVNGVPVTLERGDQDLLYVPLVGLDPNNDFVLELRYSVPGDHRQIDIPEFPEEPALQKVYLAVFLPDEQSLLQVDGPWTEEFDWRQEPALRWKPRANRTDDELVSWVNEGIQAAQGPAFQKDGTLFLFSALRPDAPPSGSLRLSVVHRNILAAFVIVILCVMGLLLLRASFATKLAALGTLLMVAVASGVFIPTLGQQLLNLPTLAGLAIVAIGWSLHSVSASIQRLTRGQEERDKRKLESKAALEESVEENTEPIPSLPVNAADNREDSHGNPGKGERHE